MKVFVCIDDGGGILFGGKRQSRDRLLVEDVRKTVGGGRLLVNAFSAPLFAKEGGVLLSDDPLTEAEDGDYCFIENLSLCPFSHKIDVLYVYKWNRTYPATTFLDFEPVKNGFRLAETTDFVGSSHATITKETYTK